MAVALDIGIGLVGAALAGIPLLSDLFAPKPDDSITTTVRIIAGDADFTDGDQPHVRLFDRSGNSIGFVDGSDNTIHRGQPRDVKVVQADPSKSANGAEYIALAASTLNDALCISILTVTTPTGVTYNWMGDIGFQCSLPWTYGNVLASESPEFGRVIPRCTWIDGDATNGMKTQGLGIHLPSFTSNAGREADFGNNNAHMCGSQPRFNAYEQMDYLTAIPYFKEPVFDDATLVDFGDKALDQGNWDTKQIDDGALIGIGRKSKRGNHRGGRGNVQMTSPPSTTGNNSNSNNRTTPYGKSNRQHWGKLVKSAHESHSAKELCESSTSWGPDFVSLSEKLYCDMDTKTLWDCCTEDDKKQKVCFDLQANEMRGGNATNTRRDGVTGKRVPKKTYDRVQEWGV